MSAEYDLICVGGGLGGFVAALRAHRLGRRPLILEKSDLLGGVAAYSGGCVWVPDNHVQGAEGVDDSRAKAYAYLDALGDGKAIFDERLRRAYVENAPTALLFLEEMGVRFMNTMKCDSSKPDLPGFAQSGRELETAFPATELGPYQRLLRRSPYLPTPGVSHCEMRGQSPWATLAKLSREELERRTKADHLGRGGGLMASLIHAALVKRSIEFRTNVETTELLRESGAVVGVAIRSAEGGTEEIRARDGVVLATGGYGNAPFAARLEGLPDYGEQAPPIGFGDGLALGSSAGAAVIRAGEGYFIIGLKGTRLHPGTNVPMHHPLGGGQPTLIVVNREGKRFTNEAEGMNFMSAFRPEGGYGGVRVRNWPAFYVFDDRVRRTAHALMGGGDQWPAETLQQSPDIAGLARKLGVAEAGLVETVQRFNEFARTGVDADFGRGEGRKSLDAAQPNPLLGVLREPPYWGAQVWPLGAGICSHGLHIDEHARVLTWRDEPISGLYATGNLVAYSELPYGYQSGFANGRNITYAYLAASHASARSEAGRVAIAQ